MQINNLEKRKGIFRSLPLRTMAAMLMATVLSQAFAQNGMGGPPSFIDPQTGLPATPQRPIPETWQKRIKDFKFLGGIPLGEIVSILRDQAPEMNFVITGEAAEYLLPPVQLSSVTLEDVFNAIRIVSKGEVQVSPESDSMVSIVRNALPESLGKPRKHCVAYSLARYLQGKDKPEMERSMKDLEEVLARCWDMLAQANRTEDERPAALSLHPGTKMLIAVGEPDQLQVIEQIVRQLGTENEGVGGHGGGYGGGYGMMPGGGGGFGNPLPTRPLKAPNPLPGAPDAPSLAPPSSLDKSSGKR